MELFTAAKLNLAVIFIIFNDGDLAQISQTQTVPFNKKTCSELPDIKFKAVVEATGCHYLRMQNNQEIEMKISESIKLLKTNKPIVLDVNIDYSKKTRFTNGIIKTNLNRMKLPTKLRMIGRALWRRV